MPQRLGIIGLGVISAVYLETLAASDAVVITAVADLDPDRARSVASGLPAARALTVAELLASDDVDTVLNLTTPAAHAEIALGAINQGKQVYGEKPLAVTLAEGRGILAAATRAGVRVGSAPDTVLGTGIQTARAAIDDGLIGRPVAASAVMVTAGHELWHPNPDFYYREGGGPLFDMGPYYITALIHLLGPIRSVTGASCRPQDHRVIHTGPRAGESIPVFVDTHVTGVLEHEDGALSTITMSFDSAATLASPLEVHGTDGTLAVGDPNTFDGPTSLRRATDGGFQALDPLAGYVDGVRGIGLLDQIRAPHRTMARANGELALHVLDVMESLLRAASEGRRIDTTTTAERPAPVPLTPRAQWLGRTLWPIPS
ncbi:Gfo/Idh/MocA family oxidoreductase [Cryobacterium adonitolivorans]|uniref:Gfo/Idh/MocA family oxidoreductase n=1 Tax=Cryobacterium adonitolivorans TaxID=1259189 RepID=A0A4R8W8G8_9MICO|nr:Gfo/Idh/MocA family oxidoreductase [Cryobacterium adonitolivorans]TFC02424.1 Gfo/Idh/MocA family oxidoreductase [Cryobacterium adonitolivorans]